MENGKSGSTNFPQLGSHTMTISSWKTKVFLPGLKFGRLFKGQMLDKLKVAKPPSQPRHCSQKGGWQELLLLSKQKCSGHIAKRLLLAHALLRRLMMATGLSLQ